MGWIPQTPGGVHGVHLESRWNPGGIQVEIDNNLAGLPAKEIPHGLQVDSMSPCGFQVEVPGIYGGV